MASERYFNGFMLHRKTFSVAAVVFAVCSIAALYGFAFRAPRQEKNPPRVLFTTNGGQVLFPHRHHSNENGGGFACVECHHHEESNIDSLTSMNCRGCHYDNADIVETVCAGEAAHPRCIGKKCQSCHDGEECTFCHRKKQ